MKKISILVSILAISFFYGQNAPVMPGGVQGAEIWFKTVPVTSDLNGNYVWQDFAGDGAGLLDYSSSGADNGSEYVLARGKIRTYNFNPALDTTDSLGIINKEILLKHGNLSQSTILGVFGQDNNFSENQFAYLVNGRQGTGVIATRENIVESVESGLPDLAYGQQEMKNLMAEEGESINDYRETALRSMTYYRSLIPNSSVWGENRRSVITLGKLVASDNNVNSTFAGTLPDVFKGYIPELIVYGRILSPLERRKIETYLAVKYAFTLDKSYISNGGDLVWDLEEDSDYNNRITAVAREDASGLYQEFSSTSYEEAPFFSDKNSNDTYYQNNSNNLATPKRLLFAGRQNASAMNDGDYIIWGDNDGSISASRELPNIIGVKLMDRQWLLRTNIPASGEKSKTLQWKVLNLTANFAFEAENFVGTIIKNKADKDVFGSMITYVPLQTKNGYFSFKTAFPLNNGNIEIRFTTINSEDSDYGYRFNSNGNIYLITGGVVGNSSVFTAVSGQKIEVEKTEKYIYLRINGIRQNLGTIEIASSDLNKEYYGSVSVNKGTQDIIISEFRHGGFCDTGNRLELSYTSGMADEFENHKSDGKTLLMIDRSGSGEFNYGDVDYYPADDLDQTRSKIIFNNVFWDTDGNGKDVFTFGYRENNLVAEILTKNPTCNPKSGTVSRNGEIYVNIISGYPGYLYTLTNTADNSVVDSGSFYGNELKIGKLTDGIYNLTLQEIGGTNLVSKSSSSAGVSLTSAAYAANNSFQFTAIDESQYEIGFTSSTSNSSDVAVKFGAKIENYKLYPIVNGTLGAQIGQLQAEDVVKIERTSTNLTIKVNDVQIYSQTFSSVTTSMRLGVNQYGEGKILNIKIPSIAAQPSWQANSTGVTTEVSDSDEISAEIMLMSGCNIIVPPRKTAEADKKDSSLLIYYKQIGGSEERFVRVTLEQPSEADLLVFDMNGRLVYHDSSLALQSLHEFKLGRLIVGTYIIKVITNKGEYSGKVLVRPQ